MHVSYRGNGLPVTDLLSGQVPMMWSSVPPVVDHIRTGRLRVLCVGSVGWLDSMPDVPTAAESGVRPGYEAYS